MGPKSNEVWKPVVCAIHGMCAGGAFYWVNESDIVISSDDATFFDPHLNRGMVSALEPAGLLRRIPIGEVMRWALMGLDERMSAERAFQIGLVSEVVPENRLWGRAEQLAGKIAAKPPSAVQGTVKAIWESSELTRRQAQMVGLNYTTIGNPLSREAFEAGKPVEWELR
jgi:enoyl-CoA hydratase/carnithine racemase